MSNSESSVLSIRYYLNLVESQDGFTMATFGKKPISRFLTPLISMALIIWGAYLWIGGTSVGGYYMALGGVFLILQLAMRFYLLPMLFKRQFVRHQFDKTEQGLDLYQDHVVFYANGRTQKVEYNQVKKLNEAKLTFVIELKNQTVVVVPKRAFTDADQQQLFVQAFQR